MFLKKVEIQGFKSFANKTTLEFLPVCGSSEKGENHKCGITAIVGPNGSGKSNIADAMRWCMGEQSMKNLRGKKAEDIIFAGSGKKAKLGSAHAVLYFDNTDKKFPLEFDEVTVSRKIFRSGESEFLVNGSKVRLQDIVDLLAGAGIGKESFAIINQGMADAMLVATPLERRFFIEEAAGVKQFQIKKERSIRKLKSTKDNLRRVGELVEEIQPHLRMLKRQADKASQGEIVGRELKDKQRRLFSYLWTTFQKEKVEINTKKEEMGREMMHLQRKVDHLVDEITKENPNQGENEKIIELEKQIAEKKDGLNQLEKQLVVNEGKIEIEKEKQKSYLMMEEIQIQRIPVDLAYAKKEIEAIYNEQRLLISELENMRSLQELKDIRLRALDIAQRVEQLRQDIEKGKKEEPAIQNTNYELTAKKVDSENYVEQLKQGNGNIRETVEAAKKEIVNLAKSLENEIAIDREKRKSFFEAERDLRLKQDELSRIKDQFNEFKVSLAKIEVREEDLRRYVFEELKIKPEELPVSVEILNRTILEQEIIRLKGRMEFIGGIDPMVINEFNETEKRFNFLTKESDDLAKAVLSLKEVIKEMDGKINEVFASTFEDINKEFTKYFRIIFGGGNAHLIKTKVRSQRSRKSEMLEEENGIEENNEESQLGENDEEKEEVGIDIFASPPGKKISSLAMLSGGERSLTSLALLFSIISHNPPPFSVLDEVEAALDEANSKRFGRIIQELSSHTQFIIITHNRETMRQASLLYGVTMGEDGISKMLSVKLDQVGQGGKIMEVS